MEESMDTLFEIPVSNRVATTKVVPTDAAQRKLLTYGGFVHVTGLAQWGPRKSGTHDKIVGRVRLGSSIAEELENRGTYMQGKRRLYLITCGGEVWASHPPSPASVRAKTVNYIFGQLCPKGKQDSLFEDDNAFDFSEDDLMARLADPDCILVS
jgi:hypothetical protein